MKKVSYEDVASTVKGLLDASVDKMEAVEFVVGISRGGLFPAMVVATAVIKPLVVAYIDKQDNVYFDRDEWIKGKKVLLVDDIVRTGKTLHKVSELLSQKGAAAVETLTPYYLEGMISRMPDYGVAVSEDIEFPWDE